MRFSAMMISYVVLVFFSLFVLAACTTNNPLNVTNNTTSGNVTSKTTTGNMIPANNTANASGSATNNSNATTGTTGAGSPATQGVGSTGGNGTAGSTTPSAQGRSFLIDFIGEQTYILYNEANSTGPIIAAAINIQSAIGVGTSQAVSVADESAVTRYENNNLIILGNACQNPAVPALLNITTCSNLQPNVAYVRLVKSGAYSRLFIMASSDTTIYRAVDLMIAGKLTNVAVNDTNAVRPE